MSSVGLDTELSLIKSSNLVPNNPASNHNAIFNEKLSMLLLKQLKINMRNKKIIASLLISPFIMCVILYFIQALTISTAISNSEPSLTQSQTNLKCFTSEDCISLGFAYLGNGKRELKPWEEHTLNYISNATGLKMDHDIKNFWAGNSIKEYNQHLIDSPGKVQIGILFCTGTLTVTDNSTFDCDKYDDFYFHKGIFYLISYNATLMSTEFMDNPYVPFPTNYLANDLKLLIDSGIADYFHTLQQEDDDEDELDVSEEEEIQLDNIQLNKTQHSLINEKLITSEQQPKRQPRIQAQYQGFSSPISRMQKYEDTIEFTGPLFIPVASLVLVIIIMNDVVFEKEKKYRQILISSGITLTQYYISLFITSLVYSIVNALAIISAGFMFQFSLFVKTPLYLLFSLFFLFDLTLCFFALALTTVINTSKKAYSASYGILLGSFAMQILCMIGGLMQIVYNENIPIYLSIIRNLLNSFPPFLFGKAYRVLNDCSVNYYDFVSNLWIQTDGCTFNDLLKSTRGLSAVGTPYEIPAPIWSFLWLIIDIIVFLIIIIIVELIKKDLPLKESKKAQETFENKILAAHRGSIEFTKVLLSDDVLSSNSVSSITSDGSFYSNEDPNSFVQIINLDKSYFPKNKKTKVHALNKVNLDIKKDQIVGMLGSNGAGKTTFMNILAGNILQDSGTILYQNKELFSYEQKIIGHCPQFDVLWGELTAQEHLYLFCKIKGAPLSQVDEFLKLTDLESVKNNRVSSYSGGMKRRLSIAVSALGDPKLLLLDEPSTGLDPKSRRLVWKLVQSIRKNRAILLTTHDMDEADALVDEIVVLKNGKIKFTGTPLTMKNMYGKGYKIILTLKAQLSKNSNSFLKLQEWLLQNIDGIEDLCANRLEISFLMPFTLVNQLKVFFRTLEDYQRGIKIENDVFTMIQNWTIANPRLEDAFLNIISKQK